eukprot:gi/632954806/ref/XP_007893156.1/ PREDICTED: gelsolin-related protein of 125 kDa-like isoform X1 [Callorhinchus milii]
MFSDSSKEEEHEMAFLDLALAWAQRDLERLANQVKMISAKREEERSRQQNKETGGENNEAGSEEFPQIKAEIMMQRCKEFLLSSSSNQETALSSPLDLELATAQEELELKTKEVKSIATDREGARRWWLKRREQMEENNTVVAEDVPKSDEEEEQKEEEVQGIQREQTSVEAGVEELSRGKQVCPFHRGCDPHSVAPHPVGQVVSLPVSSGAGDWTWEQEFPLQIPADPLSLSPLPGSMNELHV